MSRASVGSVFKDRDKDRVYQEKEKRLVPRHANNSLSTNSTRRSRFFVSVSRLHLEKRRTKKEKERERERETLAEFAKCQRRATVRRGLSFNEPPYHHPVLNRVFSMCLKSTCCFLPALKCILGPSKPSAIRHGIDVFRALRRKSRSPLVGHLQPSIIGVSGLSLGKQSRVARGGFSRVSTALSFLYHL